jgi:hypothetical protein
MEYPPPKGWIALIVLPILFVCSCATADAPMKPETIARIRSLKSIAVLPAEVRLTRVEWFRWSPAELSDLDSEAAGALDALLVQQLSRLGFRVICRGNDTAKFQAAYSALIEGETSAGPVITEANQTGADGIVFVKLEGSQNSRAIERTETAIAVLAFVSGANIHTNLQENFAALSVALVDGKTGVVLWSNDVSRPWGLVDRSEQPDLHAFVTDVFANFPFDSKHWRYRISGW